MVKNSGGGVVKDAWLTLSLLLKDPKNKSLFFILTKVLIDFDSLLNDPGLDGRETPAANEGEVCE